MKILIVSFVDENFGDILIRVCFEKILKVVLKNLNISNYTIQKMGLKNIKNEMILNSDIILFAGGGIFGLSYLNFFEYLNKIVKIAEDNDIPIIFSSMGINNMDACEETEKMLKETLKSKNIKAISVRENSVKFNELAKNTELTIKEVSDPATWSKYIYYNDLKEIKKSSKKIIGINITRGGLFKDNNKNWKLQDEMNYLNQLKELLDKSSYDYKFYTNGSVLDNNALRYYAKKYNIPQEKIEFVNSTRQLVKTIAQFDFVVAIRMHSSIISYSLEIPSINLVWNDKIKEFYKNINKEELAIPLENWNGIKVYEAINKNINTNTNIINKKYLMTLYNYLYEELSKIFNTNNSIKPYSFNKVKKILENESVLYLEDEFDYLCKINKAEKLYLDRFLDIKKKDKEISKINKKNIEKENLLQEEIISIKNHNKELNYSIKKHTSKIKELEILINKKNEELININKVVKKQKETLDRINNNFIIKTYKNLKRLPKNIKKKLKKLKYKIIF